VKPFRISLTFASCEKPGTEKVYGATNPKDWAAHRTERSEKTKDLRTINLPGKLGETGVVIETFWEQ
jgi:hypothetical protein